MSAESNIGCACADGTDEVEPVVPEVMDWGESAGADDPPVEERCCKKLGICGCALLLLPLLLALNWELALVLVLLKMGTLVVERDSGDALSFTERDAGGDGTLVGAVATADPDWGVEVPVTGIWNVNADCLRRTFSSCNVRSRLRKFSFSLDWPLLLASSSAM